jgi:hypothetical protein
MIGELSRRKPPRPVIETAERDSFYNDIRSMLLEAMQIALRQYTKDGNKKWIGYAKEIGQNLKTFRERSFGGNPRILPKENFGEWN